MFKSIFKSIVDAIFDTGTNSDNEEPINPIDNKLVDCLISNLSSINNIKKNRFGYAFKLRSIPFEIYRHFTYDKKGTVRYWITFTYKVGDKLSHTSIYSPKLKALYNHCIDVYENNSNKAKMGLIKNIGKHP